MIEFFFILFLISGLLKSYLLAFNFPEIIDITVISFLCFIGSIFYKKRLIIVKSKTYYLIPVLLFIYFIWTWITVIYTCSTEYVYKKEIYFFAIISVFFLVYIVKDFNLRLFTRYLNVLVLLLGGIYLLMSYDLNNFDTPYYHKSIHYLFLKNWVNSQQIEGIYLSLSEIAGLALLLVLIFPKSRTDIYLFFANLWILLGTAGRGPILFFILAIAGWFIQQLIQYKGNLQQRVRVLIIKKIANIKKKINVKHFLLANVLYILLMVIYPTLWGNYARTLFRFSVIPAREFTENYYDTDIQKSIVNYITTHKDEIIDYEKLLDICRQYGYTDISPGVIFGNISRIYFIKFSINHIFKSFKTILLGYGFGSFGYKLMGIDFRAYPHNVLLEVWFETGLIGLLLFLFFAVFSIYFIISSSTLFYYPLLFIVLNVLKSSSISDIRFFMGTLALIIVYSINMKKVTVL